MFKTLYAANGWGLAATQVGLSSRIFVMDISPDQNQPTCFINPEIIEKQGNVESEEDCLSFPGVYIKIPRAKQITLQYQNENGEVLTQNFEGLLACCLQHGVDSLNGVLFIDHLSKLKRDRLMKKYDKLKASHQAGHVHGPDCDHHH
jgi:peptide deformylase